VDHVSTIGDADVGVQEALEPPELRQVRDDWEVALELLQRELGRG